MAEPRFLPQAPNILGAAAQATQVAGGVQAIRGQQQRLGMAQQQQQFAQEQILAERERQAEQDQMRALQQRYNVLDAIADESLKAGDFEAASRAFVGMNQNLRQQGVDFAFDIQAIGADPGGYQQKVKIHNELKKTNPAAASEFAAQNLPQFQRTALKEEAIAEETRQFQVGRERQAILREEVGQRVEAALPKGIDEDTRTLIKLASQGDISPSAAQQLLQGKGVNIRSGLLGAAGQPVTKIFDDQGKTIAELPEVQPQPRAPGREQVITEPVFDEFGTKIGENKFVLEQTQEGEFRATPIQFPERLQPPATIPPELAPAAGGTLGAFPQRRATDGVVPDRVQKATPEQTQAAIEESKRAVRGVAPLKEEDIPSLKKIIEFSKATGAKIDKKRAREIRADMLNKIKFRPTQQIPDFDTFKKGILEANKGKTITDEQIRKLHNDFVVRKLLEAKQQIGE